MTYYQVPVHLTNKQLQAFHNAIMNDTRVTIKFNGSQIGQEGDTIIVTLPQFKKLDLARQSNTSVSIIFNKTQLRMMKTQIGNGVLDSLGSFFKGVGNTVKSGFNKAKNFVTGNKQQPKQDINKGWNFVDKNVGSTNKDLAKKYNNTIEMNNMANIKPPNLPKYKDYGQEYDHMPVGYKPPKPQTTFDKVANKVNQFDKGLNNFFGYPYRTNVNTWNQQKYAPNGFLYPEDF